MPFQEVRKLIFETFEPDDGSLAAARIGERRAVAKNSL
jgi:hypothetical protein